MGGGGNGDAAVKALVPAFDDGMAEAVEVLMVTAGVKRANVDGTGELQHAKRQDGGQWLMKVDYVEVLLAQQFSYLWEQPPGQGNPGDRAAAGQGHRPAKRNEFLAVLALA